MAIFQCTDSWVNRKHTHVHNNRIGCDSRCDFIPETESDVSTSLVGILVMQDVQLGTLMALMPFFVESKSSPGETQRTVPLWVLQLLQVLFGFTFLLITTTGLATRKLDRFYRWVCVCGGGGRGKGRGEGEAGGGNTCVLLLVYSACYADCNVITVVFPQVIQLHIQEIREHSTWSSGCLFCTPLGKPSTCTRA